jgi:hypothetical protein
MYSGDWGPGTFEAPTLNVGRLAPNSSWLDASALKPHDVSAPGKLALSSESCLAPTAWDICLAPAVLSLTRRMRSIGPAISAPRVMMSLPAVDCSPLRRSTGAPQISSSVGVSFLCDYNSFFGSEDAAQQWRRRHPQVKGITRGPETLARAITEVIGKGRLEYSYQPKVPLPKMLRHMHRYGFTRPTRAGLYVPDPFWLPTPKMLRDWNRQGMHSFFRFSLR